jgi:hypothetical protein
MRQKLSTRQRVICGAIATFTGLAYLVLCLAVIGGVWQRKEGDLPHVSPWIEDVSRAVVVFPFGLLPGLGSIVIAPFLNALFWSTLTGVIGVWMLRRKAV